MARFSMKSLPSPVPRRSGQLTKADAIASVGAGVAKGAVKTGRWSLKGFMWGMTISQLLDLLGFISPEKLQALYSVAEKLGIPLEELKNTVDEGTSQLIWGLAAQVGYTPEELEKVGLHAKDIETYAKVAIRYSVQQRDEHDANQAVVTDEEDITGEMQRLKSMAYVCDRLMLTGPGRARQLYHIALCINSIRDEDVAQFEHHERTWGRIPGEGVSAF